MCGVLYVDLDRFKTVNDTLGHAAGDQLLVEAASRHPGQPCARPTPWRALGGDEFVVLCEDLDGVHHATEVAAAHHRGARRCRSASATTSAHVSASIGIALSADGTETADALLANADIAMYRAKEQRAELLRAVRRGDAEVGHDAARARDRRSATPSRATSCGSSASR